MTAISKSWVTVADSAVDPDSPLDAALMTGLRDNLIHLREWIGASYTDGAVQNHSHDGVNSALVPVGPNLLRNGSFEDVTAGWTVAQYTGGTVAISTSTPLDGAKSLAFTSTVLANGGGDATSDEYMPVTGGNVYSLNAAIKASASNVSAKMELLFYDAAQSSISASTMYSSASVPTSLTPVGTAVAAPATARFMRIKITGGVPSSGSSTGTIYFDGVVCNVGLGNVAAAGTFNAGGVGSVVSGSNDSTTYVKVAELRAPRAGVYTVSMDLNTTSQIGAYGKIYVNGVAAGTERFTASDSPVNFTENIAVGFGALVQIYTHSTGVSYAATASLKLLEAFPLVPV